MYFDANPMALGNGLRKKRSSAVEERGVDDYIESTYPLMIQNWLFVLVKGDVDSLNPTVYTCND